VIESLHLQNFTVFSDLKIDFRSRINVIVGENSSGKTHILKVAYSLERSLRDTFGKKINTKEFGHEVVNRLMRTFKAKGNRLGDLHRRGAKDDAFVDIHFVGGAHVQLGFNSKARSRADTIHVEVPQPTSDLAEAPGSPVFIPTKEVISFIRGLSHEGSDLPTLERLFDATHFDLCAAISKSRSSSLNELVENPRLIDLLPKIGSALKGRYEFKEDDMEFVFGEFEKHKKHARTEEGVVKSLYFKRNGNDSFSASMTAEGIRKLGIIQHLLMNEELSPGVSGTLYWDEPEANLNPRLMRLVVDVLLALSRNGQQIVLATHDYVTLKWLDLLASPEKMQDHVRYFTLHPHDDGVCIQTADSYSSMGKHAIAQTYADLYEGEISRALGDSK
jgi:predicted ATPase